MKKALNIKVVVVVIILAAALICAAATVVLSMKLSSNKANNDLLFIKSYNELIAQAKDGNLAVSKNDFGVYDAESAKDGYMMTYLFPQTSFSDNSALGDIVKVLNDAVGEHRMYPETPFAELSENLLDDLTHLSVDFGDEAEAFAVWEALAEALRIHETK